MSISRSLLYLDRMNSSSASSRTRSCFYPANGEAEKAKVVLERMNATIVGHGAGETQLLLCVSPQSTSLGVRLVR
jgi:hypothetical protein